MQCNSCTDPKKIAPIVVPSDAEKVKANLRKKTHEELAEQANKKTLSTESIEEPLPLDKRPSESSLSQLNHEIQKNPLVKAFNSAENHIGEQKK